MTKLLTSGGAAASSDADVTWPDELSFTDDLLSRLARDDDFSLLDEKVMTVTVPKSDSLFLEDLFAVSGEHARPDTVRLSDTRQAQLSNWVIPASGTPDADPMGDGEVQQAAATTNFGSAATAVVQGSALGSTREAFLKLDLRRFAGWQAQNDAAADFVLTLTAQETLLGVAGNLIVAVGTTAGDPFTESTLTWNNRPTSATLGNTFASVGALGVYNFNFGTLLDSMLGNWCFFRISNGAAGTNQHTVRMRNHATNADRPRFAMNIKRSP